MQKTLLRGVGYDEEMRKTMRVGTCWGRHDLPVKHYILNGHVQRGQAAYYRAYDATLLFCQRHPVELMLLYYTGLTEITIGVMDGFAASQQPYVLMMYQKKSKTYVQMRRRVKVL